MRQEVCTTQLLADAECRADQQWRCQPKPAQLRPDRAEEEIEGDPGIPGTGVSRGETSPSRHSRRATLEQAHERLLASVPLQVPRTIHSAAGLQCRYRQASRQRDHRQIAQRPRPPSQAPVDQTPQPRQQHRQPRDSGNGLSGLVHQCCGHPAVAQGPRMPLRCVYPVGKQKISVEIDQDHACHYGSDNREQQMVAAEIVLLKRRNRRYGYRRIQTGSG